MHQSPSSLTGVQARYLSECLTLRGSSCDCERLTVALHDSQVDLNPHQVEAALFAFKSPLSQGAILADEVGLGKTIEAGLVLLELWSEGRRRLLVVAPASLRKQWEAELREKFGLNSILVESHGSNADESALSSGNAVVICSYEYAASHEAAVGSVSWDLVVMDEAHRLRNVYRSDSKRSRALLRCLKGRKKLLLTATPLQNSLLELYGLVSFVDEGIFGTYTSFKQQYGGKLSEADYARLRERLRPVCQRTLRRQVEGYVRYTERQALTQEFFPTNKEQELYEGVSALLRRPKLYSMPAGCPKLMTLMLRKLLASSPEAIGGTLEALAKRLSESLGETDDHEEAASDNATEDTVTTSADLASELRAYERDNDVSADEYPEASEDVSAVEEIATPYTASLAREELHELQRLARLSRSIRRSGKAEKLTGALDLAFVKLAQKGAPRKALLFTESVRTQRALYLLLEQRGYKGKVVLFNGSNNDEQSKAIYMGYRKRHSTDGVLTGSLSADMRAALVEEFRDRATIMVATEAAAEGVNMQFCALVVNYDMPWNPQRIEQRIGRCHRYGQRHDVVVLNFLNRANAADVRVYELLDEKFQLFNGVFGASDEILGGIESGVDFEKRILSIYNECRTPAEIDAAFDALQQEMRPSIDSRVGRMRRQLLETFDDEALRQLLRNTEQQTTRLLDDISRRLWLLTVWHLDCLGLPHDDTTHSFSAPAAEGGGRYSLRSAPGAALYRLSSPTAQCALAAARKAATDGAWASLRFHNGSGSGHVAYFDQATCRRGLLRCDKLTCQGGDAHETLLLAARDTEGNSIPPHLLPRLLELPATELPMPERTSSLELLGVLLATDMAGERAQHDAQAEARNAEFFDAELAKVEAWAHDARDGLEREIQDMTEQIRSERNGSRRLATLQEKVDAQKRVAELERRRDEKMRNLFQAQDDIEHTQERLLNQAEALLRQTTTQSLLFNILFEVE